ncbi:MAG: hypothetical protein JST92_09035 [Deltaproteobacteria bacterium]|nr:hypothetical protein [Deltaproteobacteria bacterium]
MNILLLGEGPNDLGRWAAHPAYREKDSRVGVIEALLRRCGSDWVIRDARIWKALKSTQYRAGNHAGLEQRGVLRALQDLRESEADIDAVVFVRDRDGDEGREADLRAAKQAARTLFSDFRLCGGVAIECIEAWVLACKGERRTEGKTVKAAQARLGELFGYEPTTNDMSDAIGTCSATGIPDDAYSLNAFCAELTALLASA